MPMNNEFHINSLLLLPSNYCSALLLLLQHGFCFLLNETELHIVLAGLKLAVFTRTSLNL